MFTNETELFKLIISTMQTKVSFKAEDTFENAFKSSADKMICIGWELFKSKLPMTFIILSHPRFSQIQS